MPTENRVLTDEDLYRIFGGPVSPGELDMCRAVEALTIERMRDGAPMPEFEGAGDGMGGGEITLRQAEQHAMEVLKAAEARRAAEVANARAIVDDSPLVSEKSYPMNLPEELEKAIDVCHAVGCDDWSDEDARGRCEVMRQRLWHIAWDAVHSLASAAIKAEASKREAKHEG